MRWWAVCIVLVALVVAVVVVRPGSRVGEESLALPSPELTDGALEAVDPDDAVVVGPGDLDPGWGIADVVVSPVAVGPLLLGQRQDDLAAAGWSFRYGSGDCLRVAPATVGEVALSGWVVDGRLVSAQVEMTALLGRTSPTGMGFTFGRPLEEAEGFARATMGVAGTAGVGAGRKLLEVGFGTRLQDGANILISDLGTSGVRFAEVRRAGAPDCEADAAALGQVETPTAQAVSVDFVGRLQPDQVGPAVGLVGVGSDVLQAGASPWAGAAAALSSTGCERLESTTPTGTTELFLRDGVVVGQRYSAPREAWPAGSTVWSPEAGTLVYRPRQEFGRGGAVRPGGTEPLSVTGVYTYTAKLALPLDTAVVSTQPFLLEETTGEVCSSA